MMNGLNFKNMMLDRLRLFLVITVLTGSWSTALSQSAGEKYTIFHGYELGKITLDNIQQDIGNATLSKTGDAGESMTSVCYRTPSGLIYFLSSELGGSRHDLLGFEFKKSTSTNNCTAWQHKLPVPKLVLNGLQLGMNKASFSKTLGTKVSWKNNIATSTFESRRKMTTTEIEKLNENDRQAVLTGKQQDYFDVLVSIIGTFKHGRLISLQVWKTETL
jgi:hypothetical protein